MAPDERVIGGLANLLSPDSRARQRGVETLRSANGVLLSAPIGHLLNAIRREVVEVSQRLRHSSRLRWGMSLVVGVP